MPLQVVYRSGTLPGKVVAPVWIILISALGLVVGLATYGYKVTQVRGRLGGRGRASLPA